MSLTLWHDGNRNTGAHREGSVVESVVVPSFEEVRVAIGVLKGSVQIVGYSLPIGDRLRICFLHGGLL
jgi:hypothetical protein